MENVSGADERPCALDDCMAINKFEVSINDLKADKKALETRGPGGEVRISAYRSRDDSLIGYGLPFMFRGSFQFGPVSIGRLQLADNGG